MDKDKNYVPKKGRKGEIYTNGFVNRQMLTRRKPASQTRNP